MPDNRLTLTIEAQNLAQAAFKQFQTDVRQSNEALQKTGQAGRQGSGGIKVYRDELGRFHDAVTGRYVSAARLLKEGFIDIDRAARKTAPATDIVTKSVRTLSESMDRHLNVSATRAGRALGDAFINAPGIIARSVLPIQQVGRSVARLSDRFIGLYRNSAVVQRIGSDFRSLQKDIRVTAGVVQQFSQRLTAQTQSIIQEAAQIERLKLGLQTLSPSIQESEAQYRRLIEVARLPGIDFSNALRASLQLQAIGKSGEEATRILIAFGNSLALSGASTADIQRTIYGLRQLIADGKVYQRELNLITSRVPVATPILQRRFGGVRADDIRSHFESIGVDESQQASEFIKILTEELEKLPRSSETAANALENLDDTFRRVQGAIGENLLPAVKETTAAIEALLFSVEGDEGLKTSIADWLSFATAMGTVTAGAVGVAASIPLLAGLANPIGLTALAVGALAGAFVKAEVEAARFRAEYNRIQEALSGSLLIGRGTDTVAIQKQIERLEARRTALQAQIRSAEGKAQADSEGQPLLRRGEPNPLRRTREQILAASDAYKTYQSQLFQVDKAIEVLTRRNNKLGDAATDAADAQVDSVSRLLRENLTKSIADLKEELQEEVVFEGVSRDLLGSEVDFQKSATALADIEVLLKLNIDAYGKLENAAASGNQEAVKGLSAVNKELNTLRDAAADRHIDNLSAAFENLIKTTDPSRKQLEAILKSADAFVQTFQGGADVVQDDVTRALGLISQVREQLQALSGDELRLETHDIGAQGLTEALLRFDDLQSTVQEDAGIDAQRSAEKQATAYIKAYRDSVDPAILNVVESVKVLRTELRGSIQDLEALNLRDKFTLEFQGEIGGERSDALAELFDLNQAVQDGIRENEIANLRKRSLALREKLDDDTLSLQQYQTDVIAILRSVYEAERAFQAVDVREDLNKRQAENARKLSQTILALEDTTKEGQIERILDTAQERQRVLAGSEGALKVIYDRFVQLEQDSQDKLAGIILGGRVADARKELTRFEERALDASSQRQRENLIRETAQFVDAYAERGDAFRDLVADAQDLGSELQQAFDLTEQQARLEDFRDGVADVINDLASVAVDHIFDGFFGAADEATAAIQVFTDLFRGDIELLENDVTRLARQVEDSKIRLLRLDATSRGGFDN